MPLTESQRRLAKSVISSCWQTIAGDLFEAAGKDVLPQAEVVECTLDADRPSSELRQHRKMFERQGHAPGDIDAVERWFRNHPWDKNVSKEQDEVAREALPYKRYGR